MAAAGTSLRRGKVRPRKPRLGKELRKSWLSVPQWFQTCQSYLTAVGSSHMAHVLYYPYKCKHLRTLSACFQVLEFLDLVPLLGQIVCKAGPQINASEAPGNLNALLANLTPQQLDRLPGLINNLLVVPPGSTEVSSCLVMDYMPS